MALARAALLRLFGSARRSEEQTTTANVGAFPMPFPGGPIRRVFPSLPKKRKKAEDEDELLALAERQLELLRS